MRTLFLALLTLALGQAAHAVSYPRPLTRTQAQAYPNDCVGQVYFKSGRSTYLGSGTVIGRSSVLTAGHNLYDPRTGWSTEIEFYRAAYAEAGAPVARPSRRYLMAGYTSAVRRYSSTSVRAFAFDAGGLRFDAQVYGGRKALFIADRGYLSISHAPVLVGYGAEGAHDGSVPLYVYPTRPFRQVYGNFFENYSIYVSGGMSGGPLLSRTPRGAYIVVGVVVSGATDPISGGIRLIDSSLASFIRTYLP